MSEKPSVRAGLSRRHRVLGVAVLATLAASFWALGDDGDAPVARSTSPTVKFATAARGAAPFEAASAAPTPLALPERYGFAVARRDLFAAPPAAPASAVVVAVALPASAPPPLPPPPAITLPFSFAGRLVTAAGPSVLLNEGATTRVLALGNSLGDFRFEQDSGSRLDFVHVPSGEHLALVLQP
jgi:hypothetical protein